MIEVDAPYLVPGEVDRLDLLAAEDQHAVVAVADIGGVFELQLFAVLEHDPARVAALGNDRRDPVERDEIAHVAAVASQDLPGLGLVEVVDDLAAIFLAVLIGDLTGEGFGRGEIRRSAGRSSRAV